LCSSLYFHSTHWVTACAMQLILIDEDDEKKRHHPRGSQY
jgi:hypothetical protein